MAETVLRLEIRGRVQGVGYRWAMAEQARQRGLRGWVRNRLDGSVEAVLAGPEEAVEAMVRWAWLGPVQARVDRVEIFAGEGLFEDFEQRPTG